MRGRFEHDRMLHGLALSYEFHVGRAQSVDIPQLLTVVGAEVSLILSTKV